MNIYLSTETNFENNGLGFLTDCISAYVDESLNGDYVLNITYPLNGKLSEYLVEDNIIKTNVGNDNYQLFRIARVNKDFNEIEVYALHISYDLLTNMLVDTYPQNLSCEAFGNWLFNHTQYESPFTFESDISTSKSARYVRRNPIEAIMGDIDNSMVNIFGGEVERDNFTFKLLQSRGQNNHVKLMIGKNITEIKTKVDITSMFTRIMPIGYDGLLLPEKFIDSPLINNYPSPRITKVEFSDIKYDPESEEEGVYTNIEDAYQALRNATQALFALGIDKPQITINIDWLELSKTEQYKNQYQALETVRLGDTITAAILDFDYTTKVVKTTYNVLTDSIEKFEIGTIQKTIANTINQSQNEIQKIQPDSILDEARTNATNLINNALGGYIYLDYETGNLYIMDTDNPSTAQKVWRWNLNGLGYSSTGINGTYGIAMTMDGQIVADYITTGTLNTNVIQGYGALNLQVQTNTSDIATIKAEISDIADITTSSSSDIAVITSSELQQIATSEPIMINIHPIMENISYLYPSTNLYPKGDRIIKFTNTSTNESFTYELEDDLLYYNSDIFDEFILDYEQHICRTIKRCEYNADGTVSVLDNPQIINYEYPEITLTEGNYQVELVGYTSGYIFVRLMVLNAYSAQYATKVELKAAITLTKEEIDIEVARKVDEDEVIASINLSPEQATISASKINIAGTITAINNNTTTTINGNKITTGSIDTAQIKASSITTDKIASNAITAAKIQAGTITANEIANTSITGSKLANGTITATQIANSTITGSKIAGSTISAANIIDATITGGKIANATITDAKIASINASKITAGTINADRIAGNSISASKLNISSLSSISANLGTITSGQISSSRAKLNLTDGVLQIFNSSGGSMILSNAARLSATAGIGISSNSNGNVSAPAKNIDLKACNSASVYLGSMTNGSGTSEGSGFSVNPSSIVASRNITISSDKRKKKNIEDLNDCSWIDDLKIKEFDYKNKSKSRSIGLIAQDYVEKEYNKYFLETDEEGYYAISYGNITNALIKYCQELKKRINELEVNNGKTVNN